MMLVRYSEPIGVLHAAHHHQSSAQPGKQHNHNNDHWHNIFHLTYFSFLADPTSKVLQI
jgi:hypothetical protein